MVKQKTLIKLATIVHPDSDKNIVELKLIDELYIKNKSLYITIDVNNNKVFASIAKNIQQLFKKEFRDITISKKETKKLLESSSHNNENNRIPNIKKIIAISSAREGVGKSTVSANFAVALAQSDYKVGLLDTNIYEQSILKLFGIKNKKLKRNSQNKIIPNEKFGIKIISLKPTVSALRQYLKDVDWGELDFLIIDMPQSTSNIQISITKELPLFGTILVTTPQILNCDDVSHAVTMFRNMSIKILGVIENMSYFIASDTKKRYNIFGEGGGKKVCEKYHLKLLAQIPLDTNISELKDTQKIPITLGDKNIKESYKEIVKKIVL